MCLSHIPFPARLSEHQNDTMLYHCVHQKRITRLTKSIHSCCPARAQTVWPCLGHELRVVGGDGVPLSPQKVSLMLQISFGDQPHISCGQMAPPSPPSSSGKSGEPWSGGSPCEKEIVVLCLWRAEQCQPGLAKTSRFS